MSVIAIGIDLAKSVFQVQASMRAARSGHEVFPPGDPLRQAYGFLWTKDQFASR